MKNYLSAGLAVLATLTSLQAFAGAGGGNGGDVIVCPGQKVKLLDKHEALKRGFEISIPGADLRSKVTILSDRFVKLDAFNGEKIKKLALEMVDDLDLYKNNMSQMKLIGMTTDILRDIDDSLETSIPKDCVKEQLVINKSVIFAQDQKFEMRSDLWDKMELEDQAMTVMHESIYDWSRNLSEDSRLARYLNGFFSQADSKILYVNYFSSVKILDVRLEYPEIYLGANYFYHAADIKESYVYFNGNKGLNIKMTARFTETYSQRFSNVDSFKVGNDGKFIGATSIFYDPDLKKALKYKNGEILLKPNYKARTVVELNSAFQVTRITSDIAIKHVIINGVKLKDITRVEMSEGNILHAE